MAAVVVVVVIIVLKSFIEMGFVMSVSPRTYEHSGEPTFPLTPTAALHSSLAGRQHNIHLQLLPY